MFDDMLVRSVPFYLEQQSLVEEIARRFALPDSSVVDLGCSTGTTLIRKIYEGMVNGGVLIVTDKSPDETHH